MSDNDYAIVAEVDCAAGHAGVHAVLLGELLPAQLFRRNPVSLFRDMLPAGWVLLSCRHLLRYRDGEDTGGRIRCICPAKHSRVAGDGFSCDKRQIM